MFGLILYSVLTFMAAVSMLVYLEECAYIYRKVPAKKKSIIIWVNGAAPVRREFFKKKQKLSDWTDCFLILFFISHKVIATMSCLGMWIPRATMFTDMTSAWWVPAPQSQTHLPSLAVRRILIRGRHCPPANSPNPTAET